MGREIEKRLAFLGRPLFWGFCDRPFPFVPWEGRMVRLAREMRVEGGVVWYEVLAEEGERRVLYALELGRS
ncbi:hypothetical protein [Thermus caldifontis]|uniref:hypothetical protein n=1 Tax=Thermus caldifontis TaxID=1930763 RepID=UPI000DF365A1|nr:hypothetical protein [Thermus caldifontis]